MHYVDAKGILSNTDGMNIYRGCTHGCIYCDSRSACYHIGHPFEDIEVKRNAPELLEAALKKRRSRAMIGTGSMCDPYLPIERYERLTRRCMEVVEKYGFGFTALTKSDLILRDIDLFKSINERSKSVIQMTLTTFDEALCKILEPNVCTTARRVQVLSEFTREGIPAVVWLTPTLPFINDNEENLRGILEYCFDAGVKGILCFGFGVTLRTGDREYFYRKLNEHFPGMRRRYELAFGDSYECSSPNAPRLYSIFCEECKKRGVMTGTREIFAYLHEYADRRGGEQLSLL